MNLFDREESSKPVLWDSQKWLLAEGRKAALAGYNRVILQAPTGAGKTIIMCEQTAMAYARGSKVGVLCDRRRLVDQFVSTMAKWGIHCSVIMEGRTPWNSQVQVCSRDTLRSFEPDALPQFDLLLIDECHKSFEDIAARYKFVYGFTATPVKPDGKSLAPFYQKLICCPITTKELIALGKLVEVECYDPEKVGKNRRKGIKARPVGDPIAHWKKYAEGMPTVVFAAKRSESMDIVARYNAAGIPAEHIDAFTTDEERDDIFERSKNGKTLIISNVGVLVEGVDLPWLSCCQILRGCSSLVLWKQANGRIMRPWPTKTRAVTLDHSGAAYEFGLPSEDVEWTLDDEATNARRQKAKLKDRKPIGCPVCATIFNPAKACPQCGWKLPMKKRKSIIEQCGGDDGILTRFNGQSEQARQKEVFTKVFVKCYHIARAKGRNMNSVAAMFKAQTKVNAWSAGLDLNLPSYNQWGIPAQEWNLSPQGE